MKSIFKREKNALFHNNKKFRISFKLRNYKRDRPVNKGKHMSLTKY